KGLGLSPDQAVGLDRPELKPPEKKAAARILGSNPYIRVSFLQRKGKPALSRVGGGHRDVSRRWLDRHGFPRLPIWFAGDDKALMARNLGVRVAIDDAPDNVAALAAAGIPTLVPAQPYNRGLV